MSRYLDFRVSRFQGNYLLVLWHLKYPICYSVRYHMISCTQVSRFLKLMNSENYVNFFFCVFTKENALLTRYICTFILYLIYVSGYLCNWKKKQGFKPDTKKLNLFKTPTPGFTNSLKYKMFWIRIVCSFPSWSKWITPRTIDLNKISVLRIQQGRGMFCLEGGEKTKLYEKKNIGNQTFHKSVLL